MNKKIKSLLIILSLSCSLYSKDEKDFMQKKIEKIFSKENIDNTKDAFKELTKKLNTISEYIDNTEYAFNELKKKLNTISEYIDKNNILTDKNELRFLLLLSMCGFKKISLILTLTLIYQNTKD